MDSKDLDLKNKLPSFKILSVASALLILFFFLLAPLLFESNKKSWTTGKVSKGHSAFEKDCASCHSDNFHRIDDKQCLSCHNISKHSEEESDCVSCHIEHNGPDGITLNDDKLCSSCHADSITTKNDSKLNAVHHFKKHPEFNLPKEDPTKLKFNHLAHLREELEAPDGLVKLECSSCHKLSEDFSKFAAIDYETHCAQCHSLEFDDRLPGKVVPHGKNNEVYHHLYAEYASLFLVGGGLSEPLHGRARPGQLEKPKAKVRKVDFNKQTVAEASRKAEEEIYTRTACAMCHFVDEKEIDRELTSQETSYEVTPPEIPNPWMAKSIFNHGAHESISCESCHEGASKSEETSDVLLPDINTCMQCHSNTHQDSKVSSNCTTCHSYHESLALEPNKKTMIKEILK